MKNEIIIFENQGVKLEVNLKDETVWLSTIQMAKLFQKEESNIRRHIINIFKDKEVEEKNNVQKIHVDGVKQLVPFYSLDVIISVGYRVKSKNGIIFRKWANQILKDYLLKGYVVNQKRLEVLEKTVKLIDIANRGLIKMENNDAQEILKIIGDYSKALDLLDDYDHGTMKKVNGNKNNLVITYEECMEVIQKLRFHEDSDLFALERNHQFQSIIQDIYMSFDGKDVYTTVQEKCANVLYLTVKNHAFIDGNKRIAATIFIYFLQRYDLLYKENKKIIDNNALASITLLIAQSSPKEKELMVDLILNFLN